MVLAFIGVLFFWVAGVPNSRGATMKFKRDVGVGFATVAHDFDVAELGLCEDC